MVAKNLRYHYVQHSTATFDIDPTSVQDRRAWFATFSEAGPHRLLVASDGEKVAGCASSSPYRAHPAFDQTVETGIYIDPGARLTGVGSALYGRLFDELHVENLHLAVAGIALPNDASVALRAVDATPPGITRPARV